MTINRPIEKKKQNTPKEMIKKNIPKEIKKQKTPKEIKPNKKPNKKRKQKTPKEIKLSPKIIEQHGGTNPPTPNKPMEVKPVEVVVAEPVNPKNNLTGVTKANSRQDNEKQTQNPLLVTAEAWYANNNIPVAQNIGKSPQSNEELVKATEVNISSAKPTNPQPNEEPGESQPIVQSGNSQPKTEPGVPQSNVQSEDPQPHATPEDPQPNTELRVPQPATPLNVIIGNSQPNAIPQQKSSIMTESDFMKKYGITEQQIKQVKLLLSNAFAA